VATAFAADQETLASHGYQVAMEMHQPGYIRVQVLKGKGVTKIEWAYDSDWRFMPVVQHPDLGYMLHPIDIAINKVLALAGRNEPRDFLDVLHVQHKLLSLGALCWAAVGKDPGFSPASLLELLKRRGAYRDEDFRRLQLRKQVVLSELKEVWRTSLEEASRFINARPANEVGCLYYSRDQAQCISPDVDSDEDYVLHFGSSRGVIPALYD
jgi:hypothetical protein